MRLRQASPEEAGWGETEVGPWTRHRRRVGYRNPWLTVWHDEVTRPDGEPGIYGVVHFRNTAVGVVAIDDQDRVAMVGQHRYAFDTYHWEIPEGGSPLDEDSLEGAKRELLEETGLSASDWREIGRWELSNSVTDETAVAYLATGLAHGPAVPDPEEQLEFRWMPFYEVMDRIARGQITDALTVLPLQALALERVRRGSR
ncbi:MAG: NUDIX hydrolase [Chloroflexota bacterium]|jgi:8-oxo-dGTP pyrophosphatase MutT (NUDIX family)